MDPSCSFTFQTDDETSVLAALLDAFHPCFSLQEIASAYCKAGNDLSRASEILCQILDSNSSEINSSQLEESLHVDNAEGWSQLCNNKGSKLKKMSAKVGSVSSILGRAYVRNTSSKKETVEATKPIKLEVKRSAVDELDVESVKLEDNSDHKDTEEFLFSMLGDGFKLSMDVIREVLGRSGYDIKKTMEVLMLSAKALEKGKKKEYDITEEVCIVIKDLSCCNGKLPNSELCYSEEAYKNSTHVERKAKQPTRVSKDRSDLSREVLMALFNPPDVFEEEKPTRRLEWGLNRTRVIGQKVVKEPLDDRIFSAPTAMTTIEPVNEHATAEEDNYRMLRQTAKEHWDKMKECYEAAVDAYSRGDHVKANDFIKEGRFHNQMAREADEKSSMEILEAKKSDTYDDIPLDLHAQTTGEAVRLLKIHLVSLANMPSFRYLKVIIDTDAEDTTKGKRRKRVIKLLERELIKWIEEAGEPGTIFIPMNEIDPRKLTFANGQKGLISAT